VTEERGPQAIGGFRGVAPPGIHGQGPVTEERGPQAIGGFRGVAPPGIHGTGMGFAVAAPPSSDSP
jgi:hypothetical protein